jgi:uncharacterized protein (TIGR03437 family)
LTDNAAVTTGAGSPGSSPGDSLAHPNVAPTLTLDGAPVPVLFSGLTPGLVGLYQVNFQVPPGTSDGNHEMVLTQSTTVANKTVLPVHQ